MTHHHVCQDAAAARQTFPLEEEELGEVREGPESSFSTARKRFPLCGGFLSVSTALEDTLGSDEIHDRASVRWGASAP